MRTSTALKKRIARVLNELTEIKLELGVAGIEISPEDAEYIVNEAEQYGAVSGLVTLEDLIEEIVGEIRDEYDIESPVIRLGDGSLIIDASISLRDLNEDYDLDVPESPEYETLGGFIVTSLQRIPQTGDFVERDGKRLRVIQMVGQRIAKVKLELIDKSENEDILQ